MANKRNYEWPQASTWDGYFTQDKSGGVTQRVDPATVMARLVSEKFLRPDTYSERDDYVLNASTGGVLQWVPPGLSTGVVEALLPEIIRTTSTVTVPACRVQMHDNAYFLGQPLRYSMAEATLTIPNDGARYFVAVHLVSGEAVAYLESDINALNLSNVIPLWVVTRIGSVIHATGFDTMGLGLPQKNEVALLRTTPYRLSTEGGLTPSEDGSRHVVVGSGLVYAGTTPVNVLSYSSVTDRLTECYHVGGVWTYNQVDSGGVYDNTYWDNGTSKVELGLNKYKNVWVFRSIGDDREVFYIHSRAEFNTPASAREETRPDIPPIIGWHCKLVGRITVQKGASSGIVDDFTQAVLIGVQTMALADLSDVSATVPATGQVLTWTGSEWAPATGGSGGTVSTYQATMPLPACSSNVSLSAGSSTQWTAHGTILVPTENIALVQNTSKFAVVCPQPVSGANYILAIYAWPSSGSTMTRVASSGVNTMPPTQSWLEALMTSAPVTLVGGEIYFAVILWNGNGATVAGVAGAALNVQPYIAFNKFNLGVLAAAPATITPEGESLNHFFFRLKA